MPKSKKNPKPKNAFEALQALVLAVEALKDETGLNERAVIVLLHDHTRIPKKTIRAVLNGSIEALEKFTGTGEHED